MGNENEPESVNRINGGPDRYQTLAGTTLFLAVGCALFINAWPREWAYLPPSVNASTTFLATCLIASVGFGIGWVRGFPRWSYPYGAYAFAFSLYWMHVATPGMKILSHTFRGNELWGWRAWVPLLIVGAVAFLATRTLQPFISALRDIRKDWTRLSFAVYGVMPLAVAACFDEVGNVYEFPFTLLATVLLVCGAFAFMRSNETKPRVLALLLGAGVTLAVVAAATGIYWHGRQEMWMSAPANGYHNALSVGAMGAIILIVMFVPALLQLLPSSKELPSPPYRPRTHEGGLSA